MNRLGIRIKPSASLMYGLALAVVVGIALFLRIYFAYDNVFTGGWVRFQYDDPWYHVRLIENLVHHFPYRIYFDPYTFYPHGQSVYFAPFLDLLVGFFVWIIGLGSPSQHVIETVSAYFPPILGALVAVPVYFIGKELFSRKAGLIAAALVIILPGQLFLRSLLGFLDHHVAEALFSTLAMLFLILAVKSARDKGLSFDSLRRRDWGSMRKPLIYALLTGIALGCYLLSWIGGALVILIIFAFAIVQYIIDHLRGRSTDYLCIIGVVFLVIALVMVLPFTKQIADVKLHIASVFMGIVMFLVLSGLSRVMSRRNVRRLYYPLVLVGLGVIGLAAFYIIDRSLLKSILDIFSILTPSGGMRTISEVEPLSISIIWEEFSTSFYVALVSLVILAYFVIKEGTAEKTLLLVWSLVMLVAAIGQNRFAYYFAVNVALLTAYLCWKLIDLKIIQKASEGVAEKKVAQIQKKGKRKEKSRPGKKAKRKQNRAREWDPRAIITKYPATRYAYVLLAVLVVFFGVFYPNIGRAIDVAEAVPEPNQDWHEALVWMRENTPDPFQDPGFYYGQYGEPAEGENYQYPESAYGVMSWWDYGHWITYIAHRIPNTNPHQSGVWESARFFTAGNESSGNEILRWTGSRYIVIDHKMAMHGFTQQNQYYGKFYAMIEWAYRDRDDFFETYYAKNKDGNLEPIIVYYPRYYQSMCVRLYMFDGEAVIPQNSTWVVSYTEMMDTSGVKHKVVATSQKFITYEEAKAYVDRQTGANHRIVGNSPFISPVPLEKLEHYKLAYGTSPRMPTYEDKTISYVKIFEYSP